MTSKQKFAQFKPKLEALGYTYKTEPGQTPCYESFDDGNAIRHRFWIGRDEPTYQRRKRNGNADYNAVFSEPSRDTSARSADEIIAWLKQRMNTAVNSYWLANGVPTAVQTRKMRHTTTRMAANDYRALLEANWNAPSRYRRPNEHRWEPAWERGPKPSANAEKTTIYRMP